MPALHVRNKVNSQSAQRPAADNQHTNRWICKPLRLSRQDSIDMTASLALHGFRMAYNAARPRSLVLSRWKRSHTINNHHSPLQPLDPRESFPSPLGFYSSSGGSCFTQQPLDPKPTQHRIGHYSHIISRRLLDNSSSSLPLRLSRAPITNNSHTSSPWRQQQKRPRPSPALSGRQPSPPT